MNMESFDFAAAGFVIATFNLLNIPKVKEFIPPKIRYFISFVVWGAALWCLFRMYAWVLRDGGGTVLLWVVGGFVVIFGIAFIVAKISVSIWKKSTDDAIDP